MSSTINPNPQTEGEHSPQQPVDIDTLIAQAEQRGFQRGRQQAIESLINRPALYQSIQAAPGPDSNQPTDSESDIPSAITFLSGLRPTPWD